MVRTKDKQSKSQGFANAYLKRVDVALPSFQPAAVWLNNLDDDAMTLEILEAVRAFHVPSQRMLKTVIQQVWSALEKSRERARLREGLYRLSDRELKDIGIYRGEIEHIVVSGDQRPVRQSASGLTSIDRPEQCDPLVQHRPV
jgi:uncharacterized protein YjiS (DUF1127 family)